MSDIPLMSDLRTRIAAAISSVWESGYPDAPADALADVLIRELGLRQTTSGQYSTAVTLTDAELDAAGFTYHRKDRR